MPGIDYGTAQAQSVLMLQKVNKQIELSQNLEKGLAKRFTAMKGDEIGLQNYRQPLQLEVGGIVGAYQPDGGSYFPGSGAEYTQMIVAPVPILNAISTTELSRRISRGGKDVVVDDYLARLIKDVKVKMAHKHNIYLQGYNTGLLATIDASYSSGTTIPLTAGSFGGRLIDLNDRLQIFDAGQNFLGVVNILNVNKNSIGGIDTVEVDNVPANTVAGCGFYVYNVASGNPVFSTGLQYLVTPSAQGDYFGLSRNLPYVQSPALNANGAFFTVGAVMIFMQRMEQALGSERFAAERMKNFWYLHGANYVSAQMIGIGKQIVLTAEGKAPNYDGVPNMFSKRTIAGLPAETDTIADVSKVYWLDQSVLNCVRFPGSEAFIPGMIEGGLFWPRRAGDNWLSESDAYFQDSTNYFSRLPWASGVYYGLSIQPGFSN
jgi:hypothetical protein